MEETSTCTLALHPTIVRDRPGKRMESSAHVGGLPLHRSKGDTPVLSGGEAESNSTDAHSWIDVVVGVLGSFH